LRRGRQVVGDVVRRVPAVSGGCGKQDVGNVLDMDAVEHLARLDDAAAGSFAQVVDGATPGTIDAAEAENLHILSGALAEIQPLAFGFGPAYGALGGRVWCGFLIDPGAAHVAINADGREVADPAQVACLGEVVCKTEESGVALVAG